MFYFWRELFTLEINTLWKQVTIKSTYFTQTECIHGRNSVSLTPPSNTYSMQYTAANSWNIW